MKICQSATLTPRVRMLAAAALMTGAALPLAAQSPSVASSDAGSAMVVQTKPGAMVSRIAAAHRPAGASIDQMLLAILQANPDAFMAGNINLLKKGAALTMPAPAEVLATPAADARRQIQQQNADFEQHGYRLVQMTSAATASTGASTAASPDASASAPAPKADAATSPSTSADTVASPQVAPTPAADTAPSQPAAPVADSASAAAVATAAAASTADTASAAVPAAPASYATSAMPAAATASTPTEAVSTPAVKAAPAPSSDTGINPMVWLAAGAALLLAIVAWLMLRIRRMREEERLAAEAAAAQPRAAAEALSRVWDVDHQTAESTSTATHPVATANPGAAAATTASLAAAGAAPARGNDQPEASTAEIDGLTLDLSALKAADSTDAPAIQPRTFDFSSIDLELEDPVDTTASREALQTRLELAREFLAISDFDGARALAEEIADQAEGDLEAQARQLLDAIDAAEKQ